MRKILTDKTCEYFNNLRVLLKRGQKPEWKQSHVRELTMLEKIKDFGKLFASLEGSELTSPEKNIENGSKNCA